MVTHSCLAYTINFDAHNVTLTPSVDNSWCLVNLTLHKKTAPKLLWWFSDKYYPLLTRALIPLAPVSSENWLRENLMQEPYLLFLDIFFLLVGAGFSHGSIEGFLTLWFTSNGWAFSPSSTSLVCSFLHSLFWNDQSRIWNYMLEYIFFPLPD